MDAGGRSTESPLAAEMQGGTGDAGLCRIPAGTATAGTEGSLYEEHFWGHSCRMTAVGAGRMQVCSAPFGLILCRLDLSLEDFGVQIRPVRAFLHRLHRPCRGHAWP